MKKYSSKTIGFSLLILIGIIAAFAPVDRMAMEKSNHMDTIFKIAGPTDYIEVEDLSHAIIDADPLLTVIDLRSAQDYNKYHIPGSVNIAADKVLEESPDKSATIVLASNGSTVAAQTWQILKNAGYDDVFILRGGVNYWIKSFTQIDTPGDAARDEELFRYQMKKAAAGMMMGKDNLEMSQNKETAAKPKKRIVIRKSKKRKVDEGC